MLRGLTMRLAHGVSSGTLAGHSAICSVPPSCRGSPPANPNPSSECEERETRRKSESISRHQGNEKTPPSTRLMRRETSTLIFHLKRKCSWRPKGKLVIFAKKSALGSTVPNMRVVRGSLSKSQRVNVLAGVFLLSTSAAMAQGMKIGAGF
jgi:hypothetical protein